MYSRCEPTHIHNEDATLEAENGKHSIEGMMMFLIFRSCSAIVILLINIALNKHTGYLLQENARKNRQLK